MKNVMIILFGCLVGTVRELSALLKAGWQQSLPPTPPK